MATQQLPTVQSSVPSLPASHRGSGGSRLALLALLLAVLGCLYASGLHEFLSWDALRANVVQWRAWKEQHLLAAMAVYIVAYVGLAMLSLPFSGAMSILGGALFDRWLGAGLASVSAAAGAALAFLTSRYLLHDWVRQRFGRRLHAIDCGILRDGAFYLFGLRLTPVPFCLINVGMALTSMRLGTFVFVTWLGMLLPNCLYANAGFMLSRMEHPADALSTEVVVSLALLGLTPLAFRLLIARIRPPGPAAPVIRDSGPE